MSSITTSVGCLRTAGSILYDRFFGEPKWGSECCHAARIHKRIDPILKEHNISPGSINIVAGTEYTARGGNARGKITLQCGAHTSSVARTRISWGSIIHETGHICENHCFKTELIKVAGLTSTFLVEATLLAVFLNSCYESLIKPSLLLENLGARLATVSLTYGASIVGLFKLERSQEACADDYIIKYCTPKEIEKEIIFFRASEIYEIYNKVMGDVRSCGSPLFKQIIREWKLSLLDVFSPHPSYIDRIEKLKKALENKDKKNRLTPEQIDHRAMEMAQELLKVKIEKPMRELLLNIRIEKKFPCYRKFTITNKSSQEYYAKKVLLVGK